MEDKENKTTEAVDKTALESVDKKTAESVEPTSQPSVTDGKTADVSASADKIEAPPTLDVPPPTTPRPGFGRDTAILSSSQNRWRRLFADRPQTGTTRLGDQREIIFVIRGMVERVVLTDDLSVYLGRAEPGGRSQIDIDLTPYGALDRGVSRVHARLHLENNRIYVTDLGSTNGTYLAGKKLEPHKPEPLRKGDELLLGRLAVQVLFR
jgi:hypothetical protein